MSFFKLDDLNKQYDGNIIALEHFSLEIEKGEKLAIIGESGSGKSTLLKVMAGLESQDSGKVVLDGTPIKSPAEKLVPGYDDIQLVKQDNGLFPHSTVAENISRPLLAYDKAYSKERLEDLLSLFGLESKRNRLPKNLSGGQQQKVAIAKALSLEPKVLLLDEPFSSLDALQKRSLLDELNLIFQEMQVTLVMVTHDLHDALLMTSQIAIIRDGKLVRKDSPEKLYNHPQNTYVAGLFGYLNQIPEKKGSFIRTSSVMVDPKKGKIKTEVISNRFFPEFDLITLKLPESDHLWQVKSMIRGYSKGQPLFVDWSPNEELNLETEI